MLALLVLALHDDVGRQVREADRRGGLVDVLASRAACTKQVFAVVVGSEGHFHVFRLGQHRHGGGRGVDPPLGFGVGHPLHTVAAALMLELAKDRVARHAEDQFLEAAEFGGARVHHFEIPAQFGTPAAIHLVEVSHKERRLVTSGARAKLHDAAGAVGVFVARTEFEKVFPLPLPLRFELG